MRTSDLRRDVAAVLAEAVDAVAKAAEKAEAILASYKAPQEYTKRCSTCGKPGHYASRHRE